MGRPVSARSGGQIDVDDQEIVATGLTMPRQHKDFSGLPLHVRLQQDGKPPQCMGCHQHGHRGN